MAINYDLVYPASCGIMDARQLVGYRPHDSWSILARICYAVGDSPRHLALAILSLTVFDASLLLLCRRKRLVQRQFVFLGHLCVPFGVSIWRPFSVRRYFCKRLRGFSGMVYSMMPSDNNILMILRK